MRTLKIREFNKNVKKLNEYSPDSIWAAFTTKSKSQEQCFLKFSKFSCLSELNCFNNNFNRERGFQIIKICRNLKFQVVWAELKINQSSDNCGQNILDTFLNLLEKDLAVKSWFFAFSSELLVGHFYLFFVYPRIQT